GGGSPGSGGGSTRRDFLKQGAALGAAGLSFPMVLRSRTGAMSGPQRKNTLYVGGWQWSPPNAGFSPLVASTNYPSNSQIQYLYESLFGFNLLTGGIDPILAKGISWPSKSTAVVTLQPAAHWQDGKALNADDVVFTFELPKQHTELSYASFWQYVSSVTKKDDHTVQFDLNPQQLNPGQFKHFLATIYILPKHIYSSIAEKNSSLLNYTDMHPVGSGPYRIYNASQQQVSLVRYDHYWGRKVFGGLAKPQYIVHPILKDNSAASLAMQEGELDLSQHFGSQIWTMWTKYHQPAGTWFRHPPYHLPGSIPIVWLNVNRKGLDNVKVRQAIAYSIDYSQIVKTAMSEYSTDVRSSLIIPTGPEAKFFDSANVKQNGWSHNPQKAKQILEHDLGAKKGSDGIYVLPDGTRLGGWTAITPTGWTDWNASLAVLSQSTHQVGIDIGTSFPEANQVNDTVQAGNFDLAMWGVTGLDPAAPWIRFQNVLDDRGVPPLGKTAFWDYVRFSNSQVAGLLNQAATATGGHQKELFGELDRIFQQNLMVIPLEYRPFEFYEYNETVWTNFPNSHHRWAGPQQGGIGVKLLYGIKPKV
ncbi:MAG: twin-arginine translocation signal domain-containing protein, partial [Candidatus Dormibacteraeota bacterium]|nr:twin-arginine translocation signal domain-containing protein [Candidatus Dormibacteraeota bacterium]